MSAANTEISEILETGPQRVRTVLVVMCSVWTDSWREEGRGGEKRRGREGKEEERRGESKQTQFVLYSLTVTNYQFIE